MEKIDLFKQFKSEYKAVGKPVLIEASEAQYLAIEGQGEPGGAVFAESVGALYGMAFTIKMTRKAAGLGDYVVCKLEAVWGGEGDEEFCNLPPKQWHWKMMIRTPDCVGSSDLERAAEAIVNKGKGEEVRRVGLEKLDEGLCVQMLHVGPYDKEGETVEVMKQFAAESGYELHGKHHEIYLSDPRRVPPERLKTILRRQIKLCPG